MGRNYRWTATLSGPTDADNGHARGETRADDRRTGNYTPADAESDVRDFLNSKAPHSSAEITVTEV